MTYLQRKQMAGFRSFSIPLLNTAKRSGHFIRSFKIFYFTSSGIQEDFSSFVNGSGDLVGTYQRLLLGEVLLQQTL